MLVKRDLRVRMNFYKNYLPFGTYNKNNLLKQPVPITYTLLKKFFAVAIILKVCELFIFKQSKTTCSILGMYDSSWSVQRRQDRMDTVYEM